jgi:hypothetical protein
VLWTATLNGRGITAVVLESDAAEGLLVRLSVTLEPEGA